MTPSQGAVVLVRLAVPGRTTPPRRLALVIGMLPGPFQSVLVCGISTAQLDEITPEWDEVIDPGDSDFEQTGIRVRSAARLSFLFSLTEAEIEGEVGSVDEQRVVRMRQRLAGHLSVPPGSPT